MIERQLAADWAVTGCCDKYDILFISLFVIYHVVLHLLWWVKIKETFILQPLKVFAVWTHEFGHGSAAVLTGGRFVQITVNANETGQAVFGGGYTPLVMMAGYIGTAFWGAAFVALSGHRIGAMVASATLLASLLVCLLLKPNKVVIYIIVAFTLVTVGPMLIDWFVVDPFLQYFTLFYGVFFGQYACKDIWEDTIAHTKEGSDSSRCFEVHTCFGSAKTIGCIYLMVAILLHIIGFYFGLVWMSSTENNSH